MAVQIGTASGHTEFARRLRAFLNGRGTSGAVSFSGTGNGTLTKTNNSAFTQNMGTTPLTLTEDWTVTCTAAAANGGTFSVVGSVSGAQADATVGTPYDNGKVTFTIADGTVDFLVGDQFTFSTVQGEMAASGQAWDYVGNDTSGVPWFKGKGLTGTESIYFACYVGQDATLDYYNLYMASAVSFNSATDFLNQPGRSPVVTVCLWNMDIPYWFVGNAQRVVFVGKVSTTYHAGHCGKIFPYGTPSEYAYPVYIGGESNIGTERWSSVSESVRHFVDPGESANYLFFPDGVWNEIQNFHESSGESNTDSHRHVWPFSTNSISQATKARLRELRDNIDGTVTLLPLILLSDSPSVQGLGEIDGCYYVSGHNNAAENIITVDGVNYLVVQNIHRTQRWNYWALKLV